MDDLTASLEQSTKEARKEKIYSTLYHKNYSLGRGGYGEAWLIESKKSDKKMVLKEVDLTEMDEEEIEEALGEASIMKLFNHPNIIGIKDVFKTKSGMLNIIMEYAEKGDLGNIIDDKKKKLNAGDKSVYFEEQEIMDILVQMLVALDDLHNKNIVHRDIKGHNMLVMANGQIKLADFGIAEVMDNTQVMVQELIGTPWFLSPELCQGGELTFKSDIWALGVVLYRLTTLTYPFDSEGTCNTVELIEQITDVEYKPAPIPNHYSPFLQKLVQFMLTEDLDKRISIHEMLNLDEIKVAITRCVEAGLTIMPEFKKIDLNLQRFKLEEQDDIESVQDMFELTTEKIKQKLSARIKNDMVAFMAHQSLAHQKFNKQIEEDYGDKAVSAFQLVNANKQLIYEKNAKDSVNKLLLQNGFDFGEVQEKFIQVVTFRIIITVMQQRKQMKQKLGAAMKQKVQN